MFKGKRHSEDEELKKLLRDAWPVEPDEPRATFLQRLRLILSPDHPGLLCLPGKVKKHNGMSINHEANWRRRNVASFVATWTFILIAAGLSVIGFRYIFNIHTGGAGAQGQGGAGHSVATEGQDETEKAIEDKFIYRFNGFEITGKRKLTLDELTKEINKITPAGVHVTIKGMKEIEIRYEETSSVMYRITVYRLEGVWGTPSDDEQADDFVPIK
jgi:hypothetical protein